MDFEFDNEIDALLRRQSAQGETAFAANSESIAHLDADEISAFAENALPPKIRERYTLHLADCERCRKNLSNLIRLDSETETARVEEKHFIAAAVAPIPWYRRLVAFPNLAYTLGALVLVFTGITAYTILQSSGGFNNSEMSQTYEKQPGGKGMSSDDGQTATATESYSSNAATSSNQMMSNQAAMNSSAASSSNTVAANISKLPMPSAPTTFAANANAGVPQDAATADLDLNLAPKPAAPASRESSESAKTQDSVSGGAPPPPKENQYQSDNEIQRQQQVPAQSSIAQNQAELAPDTRDAKRAPSPSLRSEVRKNRREQESKDDDAAEKSKSLSATTSVGGKTFKRENNVWYDTTYRSQPTVNVTRGTNEYKKLDAGLRGIAENLGGTVVIVWKSKAYRIQ